MAAQPITYLAIPGAFYERCRQPMLTVTTVRRGLRSEPLAAISYWCQRCGCTLGDDTALGSELTHGTCDPSSTEARLLVSPSVVPDLRQRSAAN
jgi:hypothetical protein